MERMGHLAFIFPIRGMIIDRNWFWHHQYFASLPVVGHISYSCYSIGMSRGDLTVNCILYMLTSQGSSLRFQSTQNRDTTDFHTPPRRFVRTQSPSITVLFRCLFGCGKWQWGIPYRFDDIRAKWGLYQGLSNEGTPARLPLNISGCILVSKQPQKKGSLRFSWVDLFHLKPEETIAIQLQCAAPIVMCVGL
jgi:hypothetical protein